MLNFKNFKKRTIKIFRNAEKIIQKIKDIEIPRDRKKQNLDTHQGKKFKMSKNCPRNCGRRKKNDLEFKKE